VIKQTGGVSRYYSKNAKVVCSKERRPKLFQGLNGGPDPEDGETPSVQKGRRGPKEKLCVKHLKKRFRFENLSRSVEFKHKVRLEKRKSAIADKG